MYLFLIFHYYNTTATMAEDKTKTMKWKPLVAGVIGGLDAFLLLLKLHLSFGQQWKR